MIYLCVHKKDQMDKDINRSLLELILSEEIHFILLMKY